jgi:DNA-binding MarR family transcriptional regulator
MGKISSSIEDILQYEPLLIDLLDPPITEQHIRILALMFRLGGFTTLNVLTKVATMTQPTVSNRVSELVELGYLRKNPELKPKVLVLILTIDDLTKKLKRKIELQREAAYFLRQMANIQDKTLATNTIIQAMDLLYPEDQILSRTIAYTYLYGIISRNDLFNKISKGTSESKITERVFDSLIISRTDLFHVVHQKYQKREMFLRPQLPLDLLVINRLDYLEAKNIYSNRLLLDLKNFISKEFDSIIPHQPLKYPIDIKQRIKTNLKHYTNIRVVTNEIFKTKTNSEGVVKLILQDGNFTSNHSLRILKRRRIKIPKYNSNYKVRVCQLGEEINKDFKGRDFIIFGNNSCLIIPPKTVSYYNISPGFIKTISDFFETNWKDMS